MEPKEKSKTKIEDCATIILTNKNNVVIQNNYALKLEDPADFSIPYMIHEFNFDSLMRRWSR